MMALDIAKPLPKIKNGNRYVVVAIDHYSKWCETKPVKDHDVTLVARFLEKESYADLVCPNSYLLTMEVSGWLNSI